MHIVLVDVTSKLTLLVQIPTDSQLLLVLFGVLSIDVLITVPLVIVTLFIRDIALTPAPQLEPVINVSAKAVVSKLFVSQACSPQI